MIKGAQLWILGVAAAMMGCAAESSTDSDLDSTESAIINGVETTGFPSVVALYGKKPGADKGMLCTASVVSPTVLLTAAHCVDPAVAGEGNEYFMLTSHNLTDQANPSPRIKVSAVHWDRQFSAQNLQGGHDIGVAILSEPTTLPALKFNRNTSLSGISQARLVGYGLNNGQAQTGAGIKRTAEVPVGSIDAKFVVTGSWFGTTMCSGDSGGPVFANVNGQETIIGVNSFGFIQCMGTGSSTNVATYLDFVNQYVPQ
jgi:secreted trypsin-like serine protease